MAVLEAARLTKVPATLQIGPCLILFFEGAFEIVRKPLNAPLDQLLFRPRVMAQNNKLQFLFSVDLADFFEHCAIFFDLVGSTLFGPFENKLLQSNPRW